MQFSCAIFRPGQTFVLTKPKQTVSPSNIDTWCSLFVLFPNFLAVETHAQVAGAKSDGPYDKGKASALQEHRDINSSDSP